MSLKLDHEWMNAYRIEQELRAEGHKTFFIENANGDVLRPDKTFRVVCNKLWNERNKAKELNNALESSKKKASRWRIAAIAFAIICVVLIAEIATMASSHSAEMAEMKSTHISELKAKDSDLKEIDSKYNDLLSDYGALKVERNTLNNKLRIISPEYEFYHDYAVIVTEAGEKYHEYGCGHIKGRSFYIYNISSAKAQGYTACLDCID